MVFSRIWLGSMRIETSNGGFIYGMPWQRQKWICHDMSVPWVGGYPISKKTYGGHGGPSNQNTGRCHKGSLSWGRTRRSLAGAPNLSSAMFASEIHWHPQLIGGLEPATNRDLMGFNRDIYIYNHYKWSIITGWWFQPWLLFSISFMGCHPSHWRTPSFFRGVGIPPTRIKKMVR